MIVDMGAVCENSEVWNVDKGEFLVVGIDLSTSQITESALLQLEKIFATGMPVILVTHVPFDSIVDNGLSEAYLENQGYTDVSGEDNNYVPNEIAQKFLNMVYAEDTSVQTVVVAYLHFAYDVQLTDSVLEYVFALSYERNMEL